MKRNIGLLLAFFCISVAPAFGQVWSGVGVHAGGTAALLRGDDVGITDDATDRSLGLTIGLYKSIPLGGGFALQPEVMYVQKGGELSFEDMLTDEDVASDVDLTFNVDYVEVPVTLAYAVPTTGRLVPMLYAGPYVSLSTRRNVDFDVEGGSLSIDGDEFFKRLDYGAVFGADFGVRLKSRMATIGVRYDLGIADIAKDGDEFDGDDVTVSPDVRNDEWSILVGFRL